MQNKIEHRSSIVRCLGMAIVLCSAAVASGCALPGYDINADDSEAWYEFGDDARATWPAGEPPEDINYEPRVVPITPALIRHMREESAAETLEPEARSVASMPEVVDYRVGPGDVLQVIVFGHPELTNPAGTTSGDTLTGQLVSAEGTIYYPYVGELDVEGLTLGQIREQIASGLTDYIRQPQVDVRVREFRSQRVYISGDIARPCTIPITDVPLTVVQALSQCGTLSGARSAEEDAVGIQNVVLFRDGEAVPLDLNEVYRTGKPVPLQPGDRLLVDDSANRIFMVGEFAEQVALPYSTGGMMLSDAIADAGGLSLATADASSIYVIRGFVEARPGADGGVQTTLRPKVFHLDASSVNALLLANQFKLESRDVVFAAPASLVNLNRALALITPSLDVLFRSFLIYDRGTRP